MNRKDADPVTRVVPGVTVTGPGNAAPDPVTVPVTPSPETSAVTGNAAVAPVRVPMSAAVRASTALRYHARELWLNPGRLLHSLYHGKPGSMAEHVAYLKSAAWVPEEMTGRPRAFLAAAGIAYHVIVAWPLKLAAKAVDSAADRPLRLAGLIALAIVLIVLL